MTLLTLQSGATGRKKSSEIPKEVELMALTQCNDVLTSQARENPR